MLDSTDLQQTQETEELEENADGLYLYEDEEDETNEVSNDDFFKEFDEHIAINDPSTEPEQVPTSAPEPVANDIIAGTLVDLFDSGASFAISAVVEKNISNSEAYQATTKAKKGIEKVLTTMLPTTAGSSMPPWALLLFAILTAYAPLVIKATQLRKKELENIALKQELADSKLQQELLERQILEQKQAEIKNTDIVAEQVKPLEANDGSTT